jgi:osmotically inducible protein OsmC
MDALYTAEAKATGGRDGRTTSSDGLVDLPLGVPKEMGGSAGPGEKSNPEQLFAAGYAACFHGALMLVARKAKADVTGSTVTAKVGIGKDDTGFGLAVTLEGHLPNVDREAAQGLMEQAHQVCPYSKATRGNIPVQVTVV